MSHRRDLSVLESCSSLHAYVVAPFSFALLFRAVRPLVHEPAPLSSGLGPRVALEITHGNGALSIKFLYRRPEMPEMFADLRLVII